MVRRVRGRKTRVAVGTGDGAGGRALSPQRRYYYRVTRPYRVLPACITRKDNDGPPTKHARPPPGKRRGGDLPAVDAIYTLSTFRASYNLLRVVRRPVGFLFFFFIFSAVRPGPEYNRPDNVKPSSVYRSSGLLVDRFLRRVNNYENPSSAGNDEISEPLPRYSSPEIPKLTNRTNIRHFSRTVGRLARRLCRFVVVTVIFAGIRNNINTGGARVLGSSQ